MSKWNKPEIVELGIEKTEHNWTGIYGDGGYIGDGVISGHLSWDKPTEGGGSSNGNGSVDNADALS